MVRDLTVEKRWTATDKYVQNVILISFSTFTFHSYFSLPHSHFPVSQVPCMQALLLSIVTYSRVLINLSQSLYVYLTCFAFLISFQYFQTLE